MNNEVILLTSYDLKMYIINTNLIGQTISKVSSNIKYGYLRDELNNIISKSNLSENDIVTGCKVTKYSDLSMLLQNCRTEDEIWQLIFLNIENRVELGTLKQTGIFPTIVTRIIEDLDKQLARSNSGYLSAIINTPLDYNEMAKARNICIVPDIKKFPYREILEKERNTVFNRLHQVFKIGDNYFMKETGSTDAEGVTKLDIKNNIFAVSRMYKLYRDKYILINDFTFREVLLKGKDLDNVGPRFPIKDYDCLKVLTDEEYHRLISLDLEEVFKKGMDSYNLIYDIIDDSKKNGSNDLTYLSLSSIHEQLLEGIMDRYIMKAIEPRFSKSLRTVLVQRVKADKPLLYSKRAINQFDEEFIHKYFMYDDGYYTFTETLGISLMLKSLILAYIGIVDNNINSTNIALKFINKRRTKLELCS